MKHTFRFDHLTIGDMRMLWEASSTNNTLLFTEFVAKCYEGDFYALPARDIAAVFQQFVVAIQQWYQDMNVDTSTPDAARILKGLFPDG